MALPYPGMDFAPFSTLPASDLDKLVANIEALSGGTGFGTGAGEPGGTWVSYTATQAGFSAAPASGLYCYRKIGTMVILSIKQPNDGTSNDTVFTISLPFTAVTRTNASWSAPAQIKNNGTVPTTPGFMEIVSGGTVVNIYKDYSGATFTNSGAKRCVEATIIYEAAS